MIGSGRIEVVDVNEVGIDANGDEYDFVASADKVSEGLMVNEPVLLRYPNGDLKEGNRLTITQRGMAVLAKEMGQSH